jgi:hypothetical protein
MKSIHVHYRPHGHVVMTHVIHSIHATVVVVHIVMAVIHLVRGIVFFAVHHVICHDYRQLDVAGSP